MQAINERKRVIDLAESPRHIRQKAHRRDTGIQSETKSQIIIAARLEQGERAFKMISRLAILAGKPACDAGGAMGDAGFGRIGFGFEVVEEDRCLSSHRWQLTPIVAARP